MSSEFIPTITTEKPCFWKMILEKNLNGDCDTLSERSPDNLECFSCDGSKQYAERLDCSKYLVKY